MVAFVAALALLGPTQLLAQNAADAATRQQLIQEAQKARRAGDHEEALRLAERAAQIRSTPSLRLFIAEEQSATEQLTTSLVNAEACAIEADKDEKLKNRATILRACRSLIARLKKATAQVIVVMPSPLPPSARVIIGSRELPESQYGKPYLLPPGRIIVEASAPGRVPFEQALTLEMGKEVTVSVALPEVPAPVPPPAGRAPPPEPETRAVGCSGRNMPVQR